MLSPSSVQEAFWLTIDAFNLAERFRTPVTILTDQVVSDMWEDLFIPADYDALDFVVPRKHNLMMPFYPLNSADLDVPPNVIGHGTGEADMGNGFIVNFGAAVVGVTERAMAPAIDQLFPATVK